MLSTEVQEQVSRAMAGLTHMERAAFVLRHFEGQSIEEIGQALGLKANAAKHSIFRAVKKMRVALEQWMDRVETFERAETGPIPWNQNTLIAVVPLSFPVAVTPAADPAVCH